MTTVGPLISFSYPLTPLTFPTDKRKLYMLSATVLLRIKSCTSYPDFYEGIKMGGNLLPACQSQSRLSLVERGGALPVARQETSSL